MYILVSCIDREIELVGKYQLESQAYDIMQEKLTDALELEGVPDSWEDVEEYLIGDEFDISRYDAWFNKDDIDYDWKIIELKGGNRT